MTVDISYAVQLGPERRANFLGSGEQTAPALAALSGGGFALVHAQVSSAGRIWSETRDLTFTSVRTGEDITDPIAGDVLGAPEIIDLGDGRHLIAWREDTPGQEGARGRLVSTDGTRLSGEIALFEGAGLRDYDVAPTGDGGFVAVTVDAAGEAWFRAYDRDGQPVGAGAPVPARAEGADLDATEAEVARLADGGFAIALAEGATGGLSVGVHDLSVETPGAPTPRGEMPTAVAAGEAADLDLAALDDGGWAVAWRDPGADAVLTAAGSADGGDASAPADVSQPGSVGHSAPSVAALPGSGFFVVWEHAFSPTDTDLLGRFFEVVGEGAEIAAVAVDQPIDVAGKSVAETQAAALDFGDDGLVVVYRDAFGDGDGARLTGRLVDYVKTYVVSGAGPSEVQGSSLSEEFLNLGVGPVAFLAGAGDDVATGGPGDDLLEGGVGADASFGADGDDVFRVRPGDDAAGEVYDGGGDADEILLVEGASADFSDDVLRDVERLRFEAFDGDWTARAVLRTDQTAGLTVVGASDPASGRQEVALVSMGSDYGEVFDGADLPAFASFESRDLHRLTLSFSDEADVVGPLPVRAEIQSAGGDDRITLGEGLGDVFAGEGDDVVSLGPSAFGARSGDSLEGGAGFDRLRLVSDGGASPGGMALASVDLRGLVASGFEAWTFVGSEDLEVRSDALFRADDGGAPTIVGRVGQADRLVFDYTALNGAGGPGATRTHDFEAETFGDAGDAIAYLGGAGDTTLVGSALDETLVTGEGGKDLLVGGGGEDLLVVEAGASATLIGDDPEATSGAAFSDVFRVLPGAGPVAVRDFADGVDRLDLTGFAFSAVEAALAGAGSGPGDEPSTTLRVDGVEIRLEGLAVEDLGPQDLLRRPAPRIVGDLEATTDDLTLFAEGALAVDLGDGSTPLPDFSPRTIASEGGRIEIDETGGWVFAGDAALRGLAQGEGRILRFEVADVGGTASATVEIAVLGRNEAPFTTGLLTASTSQNGSITLDISALGDDPDDEDDGSTLDFDVAGSSALDVEKIDRAVFRFDPAGRFDALSANEAEVVRVAFAATDSRGATFEGADLGAVDVSITGVNDAPTLSAPLAAPSISEDSVVAGALDLTALGEDPDGDDDGGTLAYSASSASPLLSVEAADGELLFLPTGQARTLPQGRVERAEVRIRATDRHGAATEATIDIDVIGVNDAPAAMDDAFTGGEDAPFALGDPLANDEDPDAGDVATLALVAGAAPVEGARVDLAGGGAVVFGAEGGLAFDPDGDFEDLDAGESRDVVILYRMSDGRETSEAAIVVTIEGASEARVVGTNVSDKLVGDGGANTILGESGDDELSGGSGDDELIGGAGRDTLEGGVGADTLLGGADDDVLIGGSGADRLRAGGGADRLDAGRGADVLLGGGGRDALDGRRGQDRLNGGDDRDRLDGGDGGDVVNGGRGNDRLTGGASRDVFKFREGDGRDVITDFDPGRDVIEIARGASSFQDLEILDRAGAVLVRYGGSGDQIKLLGLDPEDLGPADFTL